MRNETLGSGGTMAGNATRKEIRDYLITLRDAALAVRDFNNAVGLSYAIAFLYDPDEDGPPEFVLR